MDQGRSAGEIGVGAGLAGQAQRPAPDPLEMLAVMGQLGGGQAGLDQGAQAVLTREVLPDHRTSTQVALA